MGLKTIASTALFSGSGIKRKVLTKWIIPAFLSRSPYYHAIVSLGSSFPWLRIILKWILRRVIIRVIRLLIALGLFPFHPWWFI